MDLNRDALEDLTKGIIPLGKAPFTVHYPSNLSLVLYLAMYLGQISKAQSCVPTLKDVSKSFCAQHGPLTPIQQSSKKSLQKPEITRRGAATCINHQFCLKASKLPTKYLNHCHACKILLFLLNVINPSPRS